MNIKDTIKILKRLRMVQTEYPTEMFKSRRNEFFDQVATIRAEMKADPSSHSVKSNASASKASLQVLEQALQSAVIVMAVVAGALGVYTYRDNIRDFLAPETVDTLVVDTASPVALPSDEAVVASSTPTLTPTPTPTVTSLVATPVIDDSQPTTQPPIQPPAETEVVNTPVPKATNPGLHLGQTKTPKPK